MDCLNQQNLEKEAISLSVYKINILVIIDKIVSLRKDFSKALVILAWFLQFQLLFLYITNGFGTNEMLYNIFDSRHMRNLAADFQKKEKKRLYKLSSIQTKKQKKY